MQAETKIWDAAKAESILVRANAVLPESLQIEQESFLPGWNLVLRLRPAELDRALSKVGWHFFFLPPEIQASGMARERDRALHKAFARLVAKPEAEKLNVLEITKITTKKYAGLHLASVHAHLRHIQDSPFLFKAAVRTRELAIRLAA